MILEHKGLAAAAIGLASLAAGWAGSRAWSERAEQRRAQWVGFAAAPGAAGLTRGAQSALFRAEFTVPVFHGPVVLHAKAFGRARILINGVLAPLGRQPDDGETAADLDISRLVAPGANGIEVEVETSAGAPSLRLHVEGLRRRFRTDASWMVIANREPGAGWSPVVVTAPSPARERLARAPAPQPAKQRSEKASRAKGPCPLDFRDRPSGVARGARHRVNWEPGILGKVLENRSQAQPRALRVHAADPRGHALARLPFGVAPARGAAVGLDPRRP